MATEGTAEDNGGQVPLDKPAPSAASPAPPPPCPPCKPGAPLWMATFSDMCTLLLCFFVLILSFAEMNVPKFKQISGSMSDAFGVQREVPVVEQPRGTTVLTLTFSPNPEMTLVENVRSPSTDDTREVVEVREKDGDFDSDGPTPGGTSSEAAEVNAGATQQWTASQTDMSTVVSSLQDLIRAGRVEVKSVDGRINVQYLQAEAQATAVEDAATGLLTQLSRIASVQRAVTTEVTVSGIVERYVESFRESAAFDAQQQQQRQRSVDAAMEQLASALSPEIGEGRVAVEKRDGALIVSIGEGGAFPLGDATLTPEALSIIEKIGAASVSADSRIVVSGHTDSLPIIRSSRYRDNWDLSAARAVSVVRELTLRRGIDPARIEAIGYADTRPIASNASDTARTRNRRIEIEFRQ